MKLFVKKLHPDAKLPVYAHSDDAGCDLFVPVDVLIKAGERLTIPLGIAVEIPEGYAGIMYDKSGLSHKYGIKTFGGVIDAGYRGEIHAGVMNLGTEDYVFKKGHKITQFIIQKVEHPIIEETDTLSATDRGDGRFGSSGK